MPTSSNRKPKQSEEEKRAERLAAIEDGWCFGVDFPPTELRRDASGNIVKPPEVRWPDRKTKTMTPSEVAWLAYRTRALEAQLDEMKEARRKKFAARMQSLVESPPPFVEAPGKVCNHVESRLGCPGCEKSECETSKAEAAAMLDDQRSEVLRLDDLVNGTGHALSNAELKAYTRDLEIAKAEAALWGPRLAVWEQKLAYADVAVRKMRMEALGDSSCWDRAADTRYFEVNEFLSGDSKIAVYAEDAPMGSDCYVSPFEEETPALMDAAEASSTPPIDNSAIVAELDHVVNFPVGLHIMMRMGWELGQALGPDDRPATMSVGAVLNAHDEFKTDRTFEPSPDEGQDLLVEDELSPPDVSAIDLSANAPGTEYSMRSALDKSYSEQAAKLTKAEQKELLKAYKGGVAMLMEYYVAHSTSMSTLKQRSKKQSGVDVETMDEEGEVAVKSKETTLDGLGLDQIRPGRDTFIGFTNWLSDLLDHHLKTAGNSRETFGKVALASWAKERAARMNKVQLAVDAYRKSRTKSNFQDVEPELFKDARSMMDYTNYDETPIFDEDV
ncbi:unnamed protein product [Zymoseptoria tritici ST99CH_1A5]|uniref:G-patch domain-containing protein n=1 Tax=Zymoseptoria tritici ST99CH_1A5 TaxID=1276529 RepID=A0A1Y6LHN2_ZYMTR|nr:unnamed protein product [Zymoseptoria tritici ST99CH_1A5]